MCLPEENKHTLKVILNKAYGIFNVQNLYYNFLNILHRKSHQILPCIARVCD